jgi:hypothetical protein
MSEDRDWERKRAEIVKLVREQGVPEHRARRATRPGITINGGHNRVINIAGDVHIEANGAAAIAKAMAAVKRRRPEAVTWRDELEEQIWLQVWHLGLTSEQFFALISRKLGKYFASMKDFTERDLGSAYEIVMKLKRPALE